MEEARIRIGLLKLLAESNVADEKHEEFAREILFGDSVRSTSARFMTSPKPKLDNLSLFYDIVPDEVIISMMENLTPKS